MRALRRGLASLLLAVVIGVGSSPAKATTTRHKVVICTSSVTELIGAHRSRLAVLYVNTDATLTFWRGSGVPDALTTSNGIPVAAGGSYSSLTIERPVDADSCITAAASVNVRVEETFP